MPVISCPVVIALADTFIFIIDNGEIWRLTFDTEYQVQKWMDLEVAQCNSIAMSLPKDHELIDNCYFT